MKEKNCMILRVLCENTNLRKIVYELRKTKIEAEVFQMTSKRINASLLLYLVKTENLAIYKVSKVFELDFYIKAKKKLENQCFRCQRWGHLPRACAFSKRCVNCWGNHPSRTSQLPDKYEESNATCCNCFGKHHPISYKCLVSRCQGQNISQEDWGSEIYPKKKED